VDVLATLDLGPVPVVLRRAVRDDLVAIVGLLAADQAVHVHHAYRGRGLGGAMFGWAIGEARRRGCALVQLTSDKSRPDAHRFYHRLGFTASHEGLKLAL
jgi:GNAT superfamily N-acetyltransferase